MFDLKLQSLIALVPPPAPPQAPAPALSKSATVTSLLQKHVTDLLGHLHAMEQPAAHTIPANHHHQRQQSPQLARQVPGRITASEVNNANVSLLRYASI